MSSLLLLPSRIIDFVLQFLHLGHVRIVRSLQLLSKLSLINGAILIKLSLICLMLNLRLLLFHGLVYDCLLEHLAESLVKRLQCEVVRRIQCVCFAISIVALCIDVVLEIVAG